MTVQWYSHIGSGVCLVEQLATVLHSEKYAKHNPIAISVDMLYTVYRLYNKI